MQEIEEGKENRKTFAILDGSGIGHYQDPPSIKPRKHWWKGVEIDAEKLKRDGFDDNLLERVKVGTKDGPKDKDAHTSRRR